MKIVNTKLNIVFAMYLALMPMVMSLFDIFGVNFILPYQLVAWGIGYFVCIVIGVVAYCLKCGRFDLQYIKNPYVIIALLMLAWIILSSLVNQVFNLHTIIYLTYFLIFVCVYMLDKKWGKIILKTLLVVVAISCIMGFIDPYGKFMPGFNAKQYNMSLHFTNPNYAGCVVSGLAMICFINFNKAKTKIWNIFYCVIYLVFATYLFMNGSFMPISALIFVEVATQIIFAIKTKRCQYKMLVLSLVLIPICFLVDLLPNIEVIRTCPYNYFLECVAVFDNIFNTNMLSWFNIDTIVGADGWDRSDLLSNSFDLVTSSPKVFFFGGGAGLLYKVRPHNGFMSLMVDFGVGVPLLFIALFVVLSIRLIKQKFDIRQEFIYAIICFLMCYIVGSIVCHSFYVFIIILSLWFKNINCKQSHQ